jgi:hypothetical protein
VSERPVSAARAEEIRDGFDAMQEDMAEHQRAAGLIPTPDQNRDLLVGEFDKLEKKGAFLPVPGPAAAPVHETPNRIEREVDGKKYVITKDAPTDKEPPLVMSELERQETVKILMRLRLLLSLEDWKPKVVKALDRMGLTIGGAVTNPARVARVLDDLLEESNRLFGDWRKDPEPKIIVG